MISQKRAKEIIKYARELRNHWRTNDPYELAAIYGYRIKELESCMPGFTAQIIGIPGYPSVISINSKYTDFSKKVLCAHELGHAFLHSDATVNHFATTGGKSCNDTEQEANLFAIALLTEDDIDSKINISLDRLDGYLLRSIINFNLKMQ